MDIERTQPQKKTAHDQGDAGIKLALENHRQLVAQHIAQHTSTDAGDHSGHDHHRQGVAQTQRDVAADQRKGDQAHSVEHQEKAPESVHVVGDHDRQQPGSDHQADVLWVLRPSDGEVAQDDVAHSATPERGDKSDDRHAKDVHVAAPGGQSAGHGFCHDGNKIDEDQHADALDRWG